MAVKVKLTDVRCSFPDLFEATEIDGDGNFKYRCSFHVEPGSANDKAINDAIKEAAKDKFKDKAQAVLDKIDGSKTEICYLDGKKKNAPGVWVLTANRAAKDGQPAVVDRAKRILTAKDGVIYSGCYVNATVELWAQDGKNTGIRGSLIGVQFNRDGEAFGSAPAATADDFESLAEGADAEDLV